MKSLYLRNLSNIYTNINPTDIETKLRKVIERPNGTVSGLEIKLKQDDTQFTLITPPFIRYNNHTNNPRNKSTLDKSVLYEGYLHQPFFLPIYDELNGEFIDNLDFISQALNFDEMIYMQWLFTRASNWQDTAIQMYSSYILGNDNPLPHKFARKFQDKALKLLNKIGQFEETRNYIEEVEQKIISEGFRFQLRIGIDANTGRQKYLVNKIEELFQQYTSYNTIRLAKLKGDNLVKQMEECMMSPSTKYQILSMREILSLFGGNDIVVEVIDVEKPKQMESNVNSAIELLPDYPLPEVTTSKDIIHDIAEALKRVGITSQARVYNDTVTKGIRLVVAQFDIPKNKNITDITKKTKDIQAVLGVESLGIEQGTEPNTVKFSIPNEQPAIVGLRTLLEMESFKEYSRTHPLAFVVGLTETNEPIYLSLAKLPHLLVAGTTGSGKSVFLNNLAVSLMLMNTPKELMMVMIDPKMVEFQQYENFPHVSEVIVDMDKAESTLSWLVKEMDDRYSLFNKVGVKSIYSYNEMVNNNELDSNYKTIPFIVCMVDELADLMDTHPDVEFHIARLGQKSRMAGISLVLASQRPSADVINSRIKSNVLNAISFNLGNSNNYKTVFGHGINGLNLLGRGDGVMKIVGYHKDMQRFQSPIISPIEKEELEVYKNLAEYFNEKYKNSKKKDIIEIDVISSEEVEENKEDENLYKLKQIIANTQETRASELRKLMGVKNTTMTKLMNDLVIEGWLKKESNSKGYELIVDEDEIDNYKNPL